MIFDSPALFPSSIQLLKVNHVMKAWDRPSALSGDLERVCEGRLNHQDGIHPSLKHSVMQSLCMLHLMLCPWLAWSRFLKGQDGEELRKTGFCNSCVERKKVGVQGPFGGLTLPYAPNMLKHSSVNWQRQTTRGLRDIFTFVQLQLRTSDTLSGHIK